jgi:hypothetical protein
LFGLNDTYLAPPAIGIQKRQDLPTNSENFAN